MDVCCIVFLQLGLGCDLKLFPYVLDGYDGGVNATYFGLWFVSAFGGLRIGGVYWFT